MSIQTIRVVFAGTFPKSSSYLSARTVRVDPGGSDETGVFGNLDLPFLTVQGAISAIEAVYDPGHPPYVILIGDTDSDEDITTFVNDITFIGGGRLSTAFNSLTMTDSSLCEVGVQNTKVGSISVNTGTFFIYVRAGGTFDGDITNSGGSIVFSGPNADSNLTTTFSAPGHDINIYGGGWSYSATMNVNSPGSEVAAWNCLLWDVTCDSLALIDSRVGNTNNANTTSYQDYLLANPIFPDSDPHIAGAAYWVTGVLHKSTG